MRKNCATLGDESCCFCKCHCPGRVQRGKNKYLIFLEVGYVLDGPKDMCRPLGKTRRDLNAVKCSKARLAPDAAKLEELAAEDYLLQVLSQS